jgi:hypothetical protein
VELSQGGKQSMNRKRSIIIAIAIAAIAIPLAFYAASPLLVNTEINEPLPTTSNASNNAAAIREFNKFMEMGEQQRKEMGNQMDSEEKEMIMIGAAQTNGATVYEEMTESGQEEEEASTLYIGEFVGVNDGIHNAEGKVKVLRLSDNTEFLRLEGFKATNGPDLYVYLSTDKQASDFVNLGRLKGNIGNQNYEIPEQTDLSKYNTVLIWCQAFSVLFGSADLEQVRPSA